jgi:hypothetical protein
LGVLTPISGGGQPADLPKEVLATSQIFGSWNSNIWVLFNQDPFSIIFQSNSKNQDQHNYMQKKIEIKSDKQLF